MSFMFYVSLFFKLFYNYFLGVIVTVCVSFVLIWRVIFLKD